MASFFDPWMPQEMPQVPQAVTGFLDDPRGRAALLSAGLALMQPPSFGDNPVSQIGRAIGSAGQSVGTTEAMDLKEREAASKAELRSSQASAAETRAEAAAARVGTAGARADQAADRLAFQRERLGALNERQSLANRVRISNMYQQYVQQTAKQNAANQLVGGPQSPVLPIKDWVAQNPLISTMFPDASTPKAGTEDDDAEIPAASPSTTTSSGPKAPSVGEVRKGYRFKGGNPALPESWEKV